MHIGIGQHVLSPARSALGVPGGCAVIKGGVSAWIGRGLLAVILGLYGLYAWYLVQALPAFPMELAYSDGQGSSLFSTIQRLWALAAGDGLNAARSLSVLCTLGAIGLAYRFGTTLSGDQTVGAFLALGFVLFPPLVGVFSLATPHAPVMLLCLGAAMLGVESMRRLTRRWRSVGIVFLIAVALILGLDSVPQDRLGGPNQDTILTSVVLPYAMLWTGGLMGFMASYSAKVRIRLGRGVWMARSALMGTVVFLSGLFFLFDSRADQLLAATGYVFGIALLAVLPLIVWVRFVMPDVRAILAWLAFPVIMYSGFWVVLGPITQESFPYNWLGVESAGGTGDIVRSVGSARPGASTYFIDNK